MWLLLLFLIAVVCDRSMQNILKPFNGLEGLYEKPTTWIAGQNPFPSSVEQMERLLGVKPLRRTDGRFKLPIKKFKAENTVEPPDVFDAGKHWPICTTTIRTITDQGESCGSCWAVAAATSFSDRLCIASRGNISISLSYHQLTTCCSECGSGCEGGFPELAWDYFHRHGLVTGGPYQSNEGCQPYNVDIDETCYAEKCTNDLYGISFQNDLHKTTRPFILENDEEAIKYEIFINGPVEACYDVFSDFSRYRSGVYKRTETAEYKGGHAVRIIGWGEENRLKYWLCANSWGPDWGERGTFKILRGSNECQIEDRVVVAKAIV